MNGFGVRGRDLSIMIPVYNAGEYLRATLEALKAQDLDISDAQIEVLDNCSTDSPEILIRDTWNDRVTISRHSENISWLDNFNACFERAERRWVYILHSDDYPSVDGLRVMDRLAASHREVETLFGRTAFMDELGIPFALSIPLGSALDGIFEMDPKMWRLNPVQFVGAIVQRDAFLRVGGFQKQFGYAADLLTWWRLAVNSKTCYTNKIVGYYRLHQGNLTSKFAKSGQNITDSVEVLKIIGTEVFGSTSRAIRAGQFLEITDMAYRQALEFLAAGDRPSYRKTLDLRALREVGAGSVIRSRERARLSRRLARKASDLFLPPR
jgi:glycosyltransferase involved in cell wall biosynthesis